MGNANPSVLVIDDDPEFRDSVARLLRTVRLETRQFSSVSDFLKVDPPEGPTCLVLDVRMPGRSGLELQRDLAVAGRLNKQIANDIGISESTVKVHRTHLMRKMKARSLPELSRMADTLNVRLQQPQNS